MLLTLIPKRSTLMKVSAAYRHHSLSEQRLLAPIPLALAVICGCRTASQTILPPPPCNQTSNPQTDIAQQ